MFLLKATHLWSSRLNLLDTRREGGGGTRGNGRENLTLLKIDNASSIIENTTYHIYLPTCDYYPNEGHDHWARCTLDQACNEVLHVPTCYKILDAKNSSGRKKPVVCSWLSIEGGRGRRWWWWMVGKGGFMLMISSGGR